MQVIFRTDSRSRLSSVFASGHVELPQTTSDEFSLVCAAVSAILQAARLGVETYAGHPVEAQQTAGELSLRWPETVRADARVQAIVNTARLAIAQIAAQYPQHVTLREEQE